MTKSEKIKLFGIEFFTKIFWRKVVKDGEPIPAGPYMLAYQDYDLHRGIFWLFPVAIGIRIYRVIAYRIRMIKGKRTFFDKYLTLSWEDGFQKGYIQHDRDSKGSERKMAEFKKRIHSKTNAGIPIN